MSNEVKRVVEIFKSNKDYSMLTVMKVVKYDANRYLVLAKLDPNKPDYNGCWYGVDISSKGISAYSPVVEMKKFRKLVDNNTLYAV